MRARTERSAIMPAGKSFVDFRQFQNAGAKDIAAADLFFLVSDTANPEFPSAFIASAFRRV